jgi:hypothetical protein
VIRVLVPFGICSRVLVLIFGVGILSLLAAQSIAAVTTDDHGEVRVAGVCGKGATAKLRLKNHDDGIELRFEVDHSRAGVIWRIVLVHERRVAWRGNARTTRPNGSFEVRRTLRDLPGADAITARAWGPRGLVCRAAATLPGP